MSRLFIFGIGGTGTRVLKSLTCLLAAGVDAGPFEIVPILIDPHKDLPEFINCKRLLELYAAIHKKAYEKVPAPEGAFFKAKMMTLGEASSKKVAQSFDYDERIDETFSEYIHHDVLPKGDINRDLIELLYSERNLSTPLSVGFKGNPNIGSVVLNNIQESSWYKEFERTFTDGDRIFIVSSTFGGTGAAGFPLLVKNLRTSENSYLKKAIVGALPIMPYFKLSESVNEEHDDIDSDSFFTKTKSALTYYERHLSGVNYLYYLADPHEQSKVYINNEAEQDDKSHLVEMVGAYAILDFAKKESDENAEKFFQYRLAGGGKVIDFTTLGNEFRDEIYTSLVTFISFLSYTIHSGSMMTPLLLKMKILTPLFSGLTLLSIWKIS